MSVNYIILTWDDNGLGRSFRTIPQPDATTITEAARLRQTPADYIVAVEDGKMRDLNQDEEDELQRYGVGGASKIREPHR